MVRRCLLIGFVLALFWSGTGIALAHARLVRSNPASGVILSRAPTSVQCWFDEDLNGTASRLVVWNRYRQNEAIGNATLVPGQARQLQVRLKPLPAGSYLVLWTSVSAQDGHILRGYFDFSVTRRGPLPSLSGVSFSGAQQSFPDAPTLASIIAHWIELLSAVTWVGLAAFSALIFARASSDLDDASLRRERRMMRRWIAVSIVAVMVASAIVLLLLAYDLAGNTWGGVFTGSTMSDLFAEQYSQVWVGRILLALIALVLGLAMSDCPNAEGSYGPGALMGVGFVYLYGLAASGHAASAEIGVLPGGHIISVSIVVDWLHLLGDAVWFGGQIAIVLVLMPALLVRRDSYQHRQTFFRALDRFSPVAYLSIALFSLSGLFAAKVHIPSWYAFFHSAYGWALITKIGLIGLMVLVSTLTVFGLRPRLRDLLPQAQTETENVTLFRRLVTLLGVNPVLGAGILLATSVMFYYPVPPGLSPAGPSSFTLQSGGMTGILAVTPDRSGPNRITVTLRDGQGRPVPQAHVTILTTMLDMVMGSGLATLNQVRPGTFAGTVMLPMGGHWQLRVLVYTPSGFTTFAVRAQVGS